MQDTDNIPDETEYIGYLQTIFWWWGFRYNFDIYLYRHTTQETLYHEY